MKLHSIETTPSPQCIKLNLDQPITRKSLTLSSNRDTPDAPQLARQLLDIEGVQEIFLSGDFITLTRNSRADWQSILTKAVGIIGLSEEAEVGFNFHALSQPNLSNATSQNFGQVEVAIQVFRGIPVQVRAIAADGQQSRVALPDRFNQALQRVIQATQANYIGERRWEATPAHFGNPQEVAQTVVDEMVSLIDDRELAQLEVSAIANAGPPETSQSSQQLLLDQLSHSDWKHRLKALQQIEVNPETFSAVVDCLSDERSTIRRWAAAILGGSEMPEAVEPLSQVVLSDRAAIVRRTAGDALSDLGDESAISTMIQALTDPSPLIRWRAARFLNELGDQTAIEPLRQAAAHETEFDVRTEMLTAQERIEGGGAIQLPMWMRISQQGLAKRFPTSSLICQAG